MNLRGAESNAVKPGGKLVILKWKDSSTKKMPKCGRCCLG